MADAVTAGAAPLLPGLPDEIVVWEILVRLPPKSLLRCRAVGRAWRRTTSTRAFLLAHHGRQPSLPVVSGYQKAGGYYKHIFAFDHRSADAQLQPVARLDNDKFFCLEATCDGLVILSTHTTSSPCFSVCNPATRQHALLRQPPAPSLFSALGMYLHSPSGEYRLLLYRSSNNESIIGHLLPQGQIGCYVVALGSDQPPRYIGGPNEASALLFDRPALVGDSLHWSPVQHQSESRMVIVVFDTTAESFRQMRAPVVPTKSYIFEMDGTLAVYSYNGGMEIVDIWVLRNYEAGVWEYEYQVKLPVTEIRGQAAKVEGNWLVNVVSADGGILLLVSYGQSLFCVDVDGKLVDSFHREDQQLSSSRRLKQSLVPHTFFTALEDYAVNASPFI
ncbi:unnamed protein product [Alopecurus aequalis]